MWEERNEIRRHWPNVSVVVEEKPSQDVHSQDLHRCTGAQVKPGVSPSDQTTLSLWILQHLLSYPEAALWLDVQHGENSLVQNRVSYGFSAVSVGRHLYRKSRWIPYYKRCVCSGKAFDLTHSLKDTQQWHVCGVTCDTWARRSFIASLAVSQWRPRILSNLKIRTCDRKQMSVSLNEHFSFY